MDGVEVKLGAPEAADDKLRGGPTAMGKAGTDIEVATEIQAIAYMLDSLRERVDDGSVEAALGCARLCLDEALLRRHVTLAETIDDSQQ